MRASLAAFRDELVKLGAVPALDLDTAYREAREEAQARAPSVPSMGKRIAHKSRSYLGSMLVGALATPAVALASGLTHRAVRGHSLARQLAHATGRKERQAIMAAMPKGPIFGQTRPHLHPSHAPVMTPEELANKAVGGALGGGVVQALRDKLGV
jgi:hypothetical protein